MNLDAILQAVDFPPTVQELPGQDAAEHAARAAFLGARLDGEPPVLARASALSAFVRKVELAQAASLPVIRTDVSSADVAALDHSGATPLAPEAAKAADAVAGTVSLEGAGRAQADRAALAANGLSLPQPLFAYGSRVNATGVANARWFRQQFDALPPVVDACAALAARVEAEDRLDVVVSPEQLTYGADGFIQSADRGLPGRVVMAGRGMAQLLRRVGAGDAARFLDRTTPEYRALALNPILHGEAFPDAATHPPLSLRMRNAQADGVREVWAVTSPGYTAFDADEIAAVVAAGSPEGTRAEVAYDGLRTRIEVLAHSTVVPEHYVAGEVFRVGVVVRSTDDGTGALKVYPVAWSNLCLNLYIIGKAAGAATSIRHAGDRRRMVRQFQDAFRDGVSSIAYFLKAWNVATEEDLRDLAVAAGAPADDIFEQARGYFRALLATRVKSAAGSDSVERLVGCLRADRSSAVAVAPLTRAAIVNAFTRFAHELCDPFTADEVTSEASELLYETRPLKWEPREEEAPKDRRRP